MISEILLIAFIENGGHKIYSNIISINFEEGIFNFLLISHICIIRMINPVYKSITDIMINPVCKYNKLKGNKSNVTTHSKDVTGMNFFNNAINNLLSLATCLLVFLFLLFVSNPNKG